MKELSSSTIYDVASLARVSITTVSRFLNHPTKVNPETATTIREAMDQLAYIPHGNSGTKARRQIGRIGVLTPFFTAPSFVQRLQGMAGVLREAQYELVVYTVDNPDQLDEYLHSIPFTKRLDGLIILSMKVDDAIPRLSRTGLEAVLVEHYHPQLTCIEADHVRGGSLAATHLLDRGYRSFGFIGEGQQAPYSLQPSELRWQGYRDTLAASGHQVLPQHRHLGEGTVADGCRMGWELLAAPDRPRAVFAMSDVLAMGVLRAARQKGVRVPQELAVLGFDDIEAADYLDLSTVSQSLTESGRLAAELLLARIREPHRPVQRVQLNVSVVARATT